MPQPLPQCIFLQARLCNILSNIHLKSCKSYPKLKSIILLWNILPLELRYGESYHLPQLLPQCIFLQARFKYLIFYLILILELQKLSQIEKYHYFMEYIAFRAQIWGIISFASTFASMYFSSS